MQAGGWMWHVVGLDHVSWDSEIKLNRKVSAALCLISESAHLLERAQDIPAALLTRVLDIPLHVIIASQLTIFEGLMSHQHQRAFLGDKTAGNHTNHCSTSKFVCSKHDRVREYGAWRRARPVSSLDLFLLRCSNHQALCR